MPDDDGSRLMQNAIYLGTPAETIDKIGVLMMDILNCGQDQETIREALITLRTMVEKPEVNLAGCSINISSEGHGSVNYGDNEDMKAEEVVESEGNRDLELET